MDFNYADLLDQAFSRGVYTAPRGQKTLELGKPLITTFYAGESVTRKGFNPRLGFVEGLNRISGQTNRIALEAAAPKTFRSGYFDHPNVEYGERGLPRLRYR